MLRARERSGELMTGRWLYICDCIFTLLISINLSMHSLIQTSVKSIQKNSHRAIKRQARLISSSKLVPKEKI